MELSFEHQNLKIENYSNDSIEDLVKWIIYRLDYCNFYTKDPLILN
jgi:hypothetical protein